MRRSVSPQTAFILPFALFMALLGLIDLLDRVFEGEGPFWLAQPKYWVYPTQAILCGAAVWHLWPHYELKRPKHPVWTILLGLVVLLIWISPQELFATPQRFNGFNPTIFESAAGFYSAIGLRFLRLVIVVPLLEEIFWRGFLLRNLIDPVFERIPFGTFSWSSFSLVTVAFALAHWGPDFVPALITGALYNWVAYRTRSLSSCVLAHAVTNLGLGIYILATGQWGFW